MTKRVTPTTLNQHVKPQELSVPAASHLQRLDLFFPPFAEVVPAPDRVAFGTHPLAEVPFGKKERRLALMRVVAMVKQQVASPPRSPRVA